MNVDAAETVAVCGCVRHVWTPCSLVL